MTRTSDAHRTFVRGLRTATGRRVLRALAAVLAVLAAPAHAAPGFTIEDGSADMIGQLSLATSVHADTLSDLALAYGQGYKEMRIANPEVDPWIPGEGTEILVPGQYILPAAERRGIVINVPEMRMYYYPPRAKGKPQEVLTFPISIGRQNWVTPKGQMTITTKVKNPSWYPPKSIREEHAAEGDILPPVVPPGPNNPLGQHALRLSRAGYLIHGTDKPWGIGMRVTHGCIRMYPHDVERMFGLVKVGTPVHIVNQPFKIGAAYGRVYLEVHPLLDEDQAMANVQYSTVVNLILERLAGHDVRLVWRDLKRALELKNGIPQVVGTYRAPAAGATVAVRNGGT